MATLLTLSDRLNRVGHGISDMLCMDGRHCTTTGFVHNTGQQMMNEDLQSTYKQMRLTGLEIFLGCNFASCSL